VRYTDVLRGVGVLELTAKVAGILVFGAFMAYEIFMLARLIASNTWMMNQQSLALHVSNILYLALIMFLYLLRPKAAIKTPGLIARILGFAGAFGLPLTLIWLPKRPPLWVFWAGPTLIIVGHILAFIALAYLGRGFSIMAEARVLITTGPYSIIRHPLYLAEEIAIIGLFLQWFTLPAFIVVLVHLSIQILRMRNEERVLTKAFPKYAAYRARTKAFLPWIV